MRNFNKYELGTIRTHLSANKIFFGACTTRHRGKHNRQVSYKSTQWIMRRCDNKKNQRQLTAAMLVNGTDFFFSICTTRHWGKHSDQVLKTSTQWSWRRCNNKPVSKKFHSVWAGNQTTKCVSRPIFFFFGANAQLHWGEHNSQVLLKSVQWFLRRSDNKKIIWTASSEFGTYCLCEQRRFRRACASAQSRQNLRCSLTQAVSQEEPSDRKPDP